MDNLLSAGISMRLLIGAAIGAVLGCFIPGFVNALIRYKCTQRGRKCPQGVMEHKDTRLLTAALDAVLCALVLWQVSPAAVPVMLVIIQIALVCVFVDWFIRIIANEAIVVLLFLGLLFRILEGGTASLLGSLEAFAVVTLLFGGLAALMAVMRGNPGVGAGDLKYAMVLAITVGWPGVIRFLLFFAAAVLVYCFVGIKMKNMTMKTYFPMCLHLTVGLAGALFLPAAAVL